MSDLRSWIMALSDAAWLAYILVGTLLTWHALRILARLPEPDEPDGKPPYATLITPRVRWTLLVTSVGLQAACVAAPVPVRLGFIVWGSSVLVLVAVDALTTWLPLALTRLCALELAAGLACGLLLSPDPPMTLLGAIVGAAAARGFFWLVWRLSHQLGFGDVRLATLVGALAGAWSLDAWWTSLLAGTLLGAAWAVVSATRRRHRGDPPAPFPYGPALWAGPYLALLVTAIGRLIA